jgi:hypothetical protein
MPYQRLRKLAQAACQKSAQELPVFAGREVLPDFDQPGWVFQEFRQTLF